MDFSKNPFANRNDKVSLEPKCNVLGRKTPDQIREEMKKAKPSYINQTENTPSIEVKDTQMDRQNARIDSIKSIERQMK